MSRPVRRTTSALLAGALAAALLGGCSTEDDPGAGPSPGPTTATTEGRGASATVGPDKDDPALDVALSEPREDSVYPDVGDPGVDALHYGLDLTWDPDSRTLDGVATVTLRSTADDDDLQLDLSPALDVSAVTLDGEPVEFDHPGKDLVVDAPVVEDRRYVLVVTYSGTPRPAQAPTTRNDFSTTGWTIADDGATWTMQEPYGAFTWYPVNDQPADKALYDFTLTAPSPFVGVANGEMTDRSESDDRTTTRWHLGEPASSYLVTVAIGDYEVTTNESANGVQISYWTPRGQSGLAKGLMAAADGLDWLEDKLGPYPFDSLGFLLVDSQSGMETQTMITLGATDYTTSTAVLVHEMVHQWYGDEVTPDDWRDVWMNEGMAMYLQWLFQADEESATPGQLRTFLRDRASDEKRLRKVNGPPADYDPTTFGESNIYYGPALMWDALRQRVGDEKFFALVRDWPASRAFGNAGRDDYLPWLEKETGLELSSFFDAWLLGKTSPPRT